MKNLSNIEAALLISIKLNPDRHQVFHAGSVCSTIFEIGRAVTELKKLNYITENDRGRFHVNAATLDRLNTDVMHEENSSGVVHRSDSPQTTVSVDTTKPLPAKPTPESLLQQLATYGKRGAIAQTLANAYGVRGIAIAQMLRRLREDGKVTKHETSWFIATQDDAVETIAVPYEIRREVTSTDELKKLIQLQKGWFTAQQSFDEVSKAFIVEWPFFYGVFMSMSEEGEFNIKEDGELVSYELSCDGDNLHANCRWDFTADEFNKIVQDYIYLSQQGGSQRWSLNHCVEITKIRSDLLLHWFELAAFDISDLHSIGKKEVPDYLPVDRLNAGAVQDFISTEGCSVKAFVKFFNLDPEVTNKIGSVLAQVGLARYDEENRFLMLPNSVVHVEPTESRVTHDPETGEDTISIEQIPDDGFVFIEVVVEEGRAVGMQYFYHNSAFNGMHITPTDDPCVFNLHVPEALQYEGVNPVGMYDRIREDEDEGLPRMIGTCGGDHVSKRFEERAEQQKENPPERMYFNGEKPKGEFSAESRALVDSLMFAISERIPKDGPEGAQGPIGPDSYIVEEEPENLSMLKEKYPLVGMHLFRVEDRALAEVLPVPTHIEDPQSPYYGCAITQCDDPRYATVTIPAGHPLWRANYMHPDMAYERHSNGSLIIERDENGLATVRPVGFEPASRNPEAFEPGVKASQPEPVEEDIFGADAEVKEHEEKCDPSLDNLLKAVKGVAGAMQQEEDEPKRGRACSGGAGVPQRTVKPEWISGLDLIADQHKRSSATRKLLMEIKEYLEK